MLVRIRFIFTQCGSESMFFLEVPPCRLLSLEWSYSFERAGDLRDNKHGSRSKSSLRMFRSGSTFNDPDHKQGCGSRSPGIRIIFGSRIRIRITVKSWIRIRVTVKIQKLLEAQKIEPRTLTMEAWRLKKWSPWGSTDQRSQISITLMMSRILIRIRIRI